MLSEIKSYLRECNARRRATGDKDRLIYNERRLLTSFKCNSIVIGPIKQITNSEEHR